MLTGRKKNKQGYKRACILHPLCFAWLFLVSHPKLTATNTHPNLALSGSDQAHDHHHRCSLSVCRIRYQSLLLFMLFTFTGYNWAAQYVAASWALFDLHVSTTCIILSVVLYLAYVHLAGSHWELSLAWQLSIYASPTKTYYVDRKTVRKRSKPA